MKIKFLEKYSDAGKTWEEGETEDFSKKGAKDLINRGIAEPVEEDSEESEGEKIDYKIDTELRKPSRPDQSAVLLVKIRKKGQDNSEKDEGIPALRCYNGLNGWCYTLGKANGDEFNPIQSEVSSSTPPWHKARRQLKSHLESGLEKLKLAGGVEKILPKISMTIDRNGGSKIFAEDVPDESEGGIFEEEEISQEKLDEAEQVIESGMVYPKILDLYKDVHVGDYERKILLQSSFLSKKLTGKAINDHAVGTSGKGKSHLMRIMTSGIPNESALVRDSISSKYLYYLTRDYGEDCLDGVVIYYDDVTINEEKEATLKTLTDPGPTDTATHGTVEDQQRIDLRIDGLPVVAVSSVDTFQSEQMRNRFFVDHPNEGENLDKQVAATQKKFGKQGILEPEANIDYELAKAIYRKLTEKAGDYKVIIPFDWEWQYTSDRRLQPLFLKLLYTITQVNYAKRVEFEGHLLATFEDFYLTKLVMDTFILSTAENMTEKMKKIHEVLPQEEDEAITRGEIAEETGLGYGSVRYNLEEEGKLCDIGFANKKKEDNEWVYWRTEKDVVNSCVRLTQRCETFKELKKDFKRTLNLVVVDSEHYKSKKVNSDFEGIWQEYKSNLPTFHILLATTTRMNLAPEDLFDLIDIDLDCETISQLKTTAKEELERSLVRLAGDMYSFYQEKFDGRATSIEDFVSAAQDRFPYEPRDKLEEVAEGMEEDRDDVNFMEKLGGS